MTVPLDTFANLLLTGGTKDEGRPAAARRIGLFKLLAFAALAWALGGANCSAAEDARRWVGLADTTFTNLTSENGLPSPAVTALAQDGAGFLWIGTQDGLVRWDGYRFVTYRPDPKNPNALPDNYVLCLHVDRRGRLWVGTTAGGLALYHPDRDDFTTYSAGPTGLSHVRVYSLTDDGRGGLWIGTEGGLDHLDLDTGTVKRLNHDDSDPGSIPDNHVHSVLRDRSGVLWVGTSAGLVRRPPGKAQFSPVSLPAPEISPKKIHALFEDSAGRIWFGSVDQGAYVIRPGDAVPHAIHETAAGQDSLNTEWVYTIDEPTPGEVWLGTYGEGIVSVDTATWQTHRIRHLPPQSTSLANDTVWVLYRDRSGLFWVGTDEGLGRYDPGRAGILTVFGGTGLSDGLSGQDVSSVLSTSDGRIWAGLHAGGVDILDPAAGRVATLSPDPTRPETALPGSEIVALAEAPGQGVFLGTLKGLYRAAPSGDHLTRVVVSAAHLDMTVSALARDGRTLWIGAQGLWALDLSTGEVSQRYRPDQLTDATVDTIAVVPGRELWAGTFNGLNRIDLATAAVERILPDANNPHSLSIGYISSVLVDRSGHIWVATQGGGINIVEGRDEAGHVTFRHLGTAQGLPNQNVDKLLLGSDGRIWASTDGGIAVIDPQDLSIRAYRHAEGNILRGYWTGSGDATGRGELAFGGAGGLTVIEPQHLANWSYHPPVVITDLRVGGKPVPAGRFNDAGSVAPVTLLPQADSLAVEFSALDFSAPERNAYSYRLDGYDPDWIETDATRRLASYTNLAPGNYVLRLRGTNRDGTWTDKTLALPVRVLPAWYQTTWWQLLLALGGSLAAAGVVQSRTAYLRRQRVALEAQIAARTAELSARGDELQKRTGELETANVELARSRGAVSNLLDSSGEGFLSFGADFRVDPEYSRACEIMLGETPAGKDAALLLFGRDERAVALFRSTIARVLANPDERRQALMLSLLPGELTVGQRLLAIKYRTLENGRVMVVLNDVTDERRLAQLVEEQHRRQAMIVAAVTDSREFFDAVDEFRQFAGSAFAELRAIPSPGLALDRLYREVHTFKALLGQFAFRAAPALLHEFETKLSVLRGTNVTPAQLDDLSAQFRVDDYQAALDTDLDVLREALGAEFVDHGRRILLTAEQAERLATQAEKLLAGDRFGGALPELRELLLQVSQLAWIDLADALRAYDRVLRQAAGRRDKMVAQLRVEGGTGMRLDPAVHARFLNSLVHVFRNAVVHGIEDPVLRRAAGKPEAGNVSCLVRRRNGLIELTIRDDGGGIDFAALRRRAEERGMTVSEFGDAELADLIFRDGISLHDQIDELGGRGVGLAAVRSAVLALGGKVTVRTWLGLGTEFSFVWPDGPPPSVHAIKTVAVR